MRRFLLRNQGIFEGDVVHHPSKIPAVNQQKAPWSCGLRRNTLLATLKRLNLEPLGSLRFALRINVFRLATKRTSKSQQNLRGEKIA